MDNLKYTVKLEQYTPMLHFQWGEEGVCLRASEVKPKLDRFVIQYMALNGIKPQDLPEGWSDYDKTTPTKHVALRYKMRFSAKAKPIDEKRRIHPLYFGAMGQENRDRIKEVCFENLSMTLVCMLKNTINLPGLGGEVTLMEILKTLLPDFFATHCFGNRSNKGFGSFGVVFDDEKKERIPSLLPPDCERAFYMSYNQHIRDMHRRLDDVYVISSLMKGGVNLPNPYNFKDSIYFKSQLRQYSIRKYAAVGSEKAFIKSKVFSNYERETYKRYCTNYAANESDVRDEQYKEYAFYRALLGITDGYSYRSYTPRGQKVGFSKRVSVSPEDNNIDRFPNPVVFKPDVNGLLVMVYSVPQKLREAAFKFGNCNQALKPPKDFDLVEFVRECLHAYVDPKPEDTWKNWNRVKDATIFGRPNVKYGTSMESFKKIKEFPQWMKEENKHG